LKYGGRGFINAYVSNKLDRDNVSRNVKFVTQCNNKGTLVS